MSDQEIVVAVLNGDIDAYGELVTRHQTGLIRHIQAMTHDFDIAQDVAQEAFMKTYVCLDTYDPNYKFSTWLYRIAINKTYDYLRKKPVVPLEDAPVVISSTDIEQEAEQQEQAAMVRQAISRLPLNYRVVISLYYWQHFQYQEISDTLDMPLNTVKTWLKRAKQQLKEKLDGQI